MSADKFDSVLNKILSEFSSKDESLIKREQAIRDAMLDLSNIKIRPWNFFKVLRLMKRIVALIGVVSTASLTMSSSINERQIKCIKAIRNIQGKMRESKD